MRIMKEKNEAVQAAPDMVCYQSIHRIGKTGNIRYSLWGLLILIIVIMFLPWTQNIRARGLVTTRTQDQRPQQVQSPIAGKIVKWWVKEGDFVRKGDTLLQLTEVKDVYLDPQLIDKTSLQLEAKKASVGMYKDKASITERQIEAIENTRELKLRQLDNKLEQLDLKLKADGAELEAAKKEAEIAEDQLTRQQKMFDAGLVSQTQLQQRVVAFRNAAARKTVLENRIAQTKQEILNTKLEQNTTIQENLEKLQKARGERIQSINEATQGEGDVAKLENTLSNYKLRNQMYVVIAPQDGQIVQARRSGLGEIVKENEPILFVVPTQDQFAVEIFVRPLDFPLLSTGQEVRFVFDGFPAVVFSGWPEGSYGTFAGKISAYETKVNEDGFFRVLVTEDARQKKWPPQLKVGSGAKSIILLNDVPIWYELWRNINGFPPDYYYSKDDQKKKKSVKSDV